MEVSDNESSIDTPLNQQHADVPERPDWLPERYKSPQDFAKAYSELERRLGVAPKEYDFKKHESWLDTQFEPLKEMAAFARSKHVPGDVMDNILGTIGSYMDQFKINEEAEIAKLGENAKERLETLNNWVEANFSKDVSEELMRTMTTAESIKALEEVRKKMVDNTTQIPSSQSAATDGPITVKSLQDELKQNLDKFQNDTAYRKKWEDRMELAIRNSQKD